MVVIDNATQEFAISNDGKLVAAMLGQTEEEVLFYQFEGFEPRTVAGVSQFIISEDSQTLVYLQTTDSSQQAKLYSVTANGEPIMLVDNVALIGDISNDGKSIAYVVNYSEKNHTAELYVIRNGGKPEFHR